MTNYTTLGNRVQCTQCNATSKRTKQRCGNPAMKGKKVCRHHGGLSRGPSPEGRAKIAKANTVHGRETREKRLNNSALMSELRVIEEFMFELGMFPDGTARLAGRKPLGYPTQAEQWEELRKLDVDDRRAAIRGFLRLSITGN